MTWRRRSMQPHRINYMDEMIFHFHTKGFLPSWNIINRKKIVTGETHRPGLNQGLFDDTDGCSNRSRRLCRMNSIESEIADDVEASAADEYDSSCSRSKLKLMARLKSSSIELKFSSGAIAAGCGSPTGWLLCKLCRMALFRASWSSPSSISFQLMARAAFNCSSSSSGSCFWVGAFRKWRGERGAKVRTLSASQLGRSPTTIKMEYLSV